VWSTVPTPSNYNDAGMQIRVDPDALYGYATVDMKNQAEVLVGSLNRIRDIWQGLALGWVGTSAAEAHDFSDRWNHAIEQLFGTNDDLNSGALPKIATAVAIASINYGEAEDVVVKMFQSLLDALNASPGTPTPPVRHQDEGPVTEQSPPW
jgi:uncharacterized protein YukE